MMNILERKIALLLRALSKTNSVMQIIAITWFFLTIIMQLIIMFSFLLHYIEKAAASKISITIT